MGHFEKLLNVPLHDDGDFTDTMFDMHLPNLPSADALNSPISSDEVRAAIKVLNPTADDAAAQQYEGRGNRAKALCPGRGDEPAQMCTKQPAKEKAQQGEGAPRPFHHHQSISPGHRLAKLADQGHA
ncbi:MAG: hypothetical protein FRX49_01734 [Trebouxia sp. A1-2]|nr:MAG: hypothetical protein FRX49_01734 [Trebouxia sp. A1-2]